MTRDGLITGVRRIFSPITFENHPVPFSLLRTLRIFPKWALPNDPSANRAKVKARSSISAEMSLNQFYSVQVYNDRSKEMDEWSLICLIFNLLHRNPGLSPLFKLMKQYWTIIFHSEVMTQSICFLFLFNRPEYCIETKWFILRYHTFIRKSVSIVAISSKFHSFITLFTLFHWEFVSVMMKNGLPICILSVMPSLRLSH